jgi:DsbC/DsbD-like thiol-disulfide interchange protein
MRTLICLLISCAMPLAAFAQKKLGEAVSLDGVEIKGEAIPGGRVTAVLKFKLEKGYHTHSNKPSEPQFIATVLTLGEAKGVKAGTVAYPEGKSEKVAGLAKPLSVYEDHFELSVPIGITPAAKLPVTILASLHYQACQGAQCYRPYDLKVDIVLPAKK